MAVNYPNIEALELKFRILMFERVGEEYKNNFVIDSNVFPQMWPNTAGGFSRPGMVSGQAFTKEYTTVMFCNELNMACVSFGNQPAYLVHNPNETFLNDFNNRQMKSLYESEKFYKDEQEQEEHGEESTLRDTDPE